MRGGTFLSLLLVLLTEGPPLQSILTAEASTESFSGPSWAQMYGSPSRTNFYEFGGSGAVSEYGLSWVASAAWPARGGPIVGDIDGGGDEEIVVGFSDGVAVYDSEGALRWKSAKSVSEPNHLALGYLPDGSAIIVQASGLPDEKVIAYDSQGGVLWSAPASDDGYGREGPPLVVPNDGATGPQLAIGYHGFVYQDRAHPFGFEVLDLATGGLLQKLVTRHHGYAASYSDLDGDGTGDLLVATARGDLPNATMVEEANSAHGELVGFSAATLATPAAVGVAGYVQKWSDEYSGGYWGAQRPPAIADLDGDGKEEIVLLTGSKSIVRVYAADGELLAQLPWNVYHTMKELVLADITGDGRSEILLAAGNVTYAYEFADSSVRLLWAVDFSEEVTGLTGANLDGVGKPEIIVASGTNDHVWYGSRQHQPVRRDIPYPSEHGSLWVLDSSGKPLWNSERTSSLLQNLAVSDIDANGGLEILAAGQRGRLYVFAQVPDHPSSIAQMEHAADEAANALCPSWAKRCDSQDKNEAGQSAVTTPQEPRPLHEDPLGNQASTAVPEDSGNEATGESPRRGLPGAEPFLVGLALAFGAVFRRRRLGRQD